MPSIASLKKNILVVDDNAINRRILHKILSGDYNVLEAENGEVALSILRKNYESISVVLLDIVMPVLDGYEVLKQMHEDAYLSKIPVIVASGQNSEDAEVRALSLGANDYVLKPYKPEIIKHRIANTISFKESSAFINSVQHDALTGVYGKDYFYLQVKETLQSNPDKKYDIICLDVERFKLVNDMYGMQVGDALLKHIGAVIMETLPEKGFCGRIGGDEFACLIEHRESYQKNYFIDSMEKVNKFSDTIRLNLVLRYGIYYIEDASTPVNIMCDRAMLAKESIKGKYDTYFAYYDDAIRRKLLDEQLIVSDMKKALAEGQFTAYFQPKYDLKTDEIVGAEALVRWIHPEKGFMTPDSFIPLFEKNGFITDMDLYIWELCCQKIKAWRDAGNVTTPVSINVSRTDIYDPNLPQMILALVQKYELSPRDLHLEITESAYTENPEQLIETVSKLKKYGFIIEMDDFGTGYSSLNMLSELPIDILKLDMRFIQKEEKKHRDRSILSFIISLAKWMDLKVVAEGIETAAQVQLLQSLSCEYAQGYYYAKPMPQEQFEAHLLKSKIQVEAKQNAGETGTAAEEARPVAVLFDADEADLPLLQKEYGHRCRFERAQTAKEAAALLRRWEMRLCALILSLPAEVSQDEISGLVKTCKKLTVPAVVIYDKADAAASKIINLEITDYIPRPIEPRQFSMRMKNAMAYAKMEKFEREKEINAAIIEMRKRAEHDALTGLFNRAEYEARIDHFFIENSEPKGVFIILDVDDFKTVNDTYGHVTGDRVLYAVGRYIAALFPETEIVARIGGDKFSLFIPYLPPMPQLEAKLHRLCSRVTLGAEHVTISCSAGVCFSPDYGMSHNDLYRNADRALFSAKRHGKSQFEIFLPEMSVVPPSVFEQKTLEMLDNVSDAMFVCDAVTSRILYINDTACAVLQKDKEQCMDRRCYELFWDQCRNCARCEYIGEHTEDFYEETTLMKDHRTPVHIKARLEQWDGHSVKVHYLHIGEPLAEA
ncbi:MAG: EAL domain-containing protein [Cloacibacillus sp.]